MWNLPKGEEFLPNASLQQLEVSTRQKTEQNQKYASYAPSTENEAASLDDIAEITNLKRATVHSILRRFQERGISGKDAIKQTGRPAFLTPQPTQRTCQTTRKRTAKKQNGLWSTKEVQEYIKQQYGVEYTNVHIWELLKALGFTLQKPRPRHHKQPDAEELERFKKKLPGWRAIIEQEAG